VTVSATQRLGTSTYLFEGRSPFGIDQWEYLPFEVPAGVGRITVTSDFQRFTVASGIAGNVLDLGIFGPAGLRGWSGGARTTFTLAETDATPGYVAGPVAPGMWEVALGPVVLNPLGMRWRVRVDLAADDVPGPVFLPRPPPVEVPGRGPGWYRGDLHLHTVHSDGRRTPAELADTARANGLDFVVSTEHNTNAANQLWGAEDLTGLLVVPGIEVTTRHGHWLAVGIPPDEWFDWRYGPRDGRFPEYAERVRAAGGMVVAAHPALPMPSCAWEFGYRHVDAMEVWNGRWTPDDELALRTWDRLLRRGRRIVAVAGSDSHAAHQAVGRPYVAVRAPRLSTPSVVEALLHGHSYLADSRDVTLDVRATAGGVSAGPGEELRVTGDVVVEATITGAPGARLTLRTAHGIAARGVDTVRWRGSGVAARYVRVEARRPTGFRTMLALSNPIWLS
jgi:predicted metal-dependent phosphoesterase TrpH